MADSIIPDGYFGEEYSDDIAFVIKPSAVLGEVTSKYQTSTYIQTETFGKLLLQDGLVYLADKGNESIYEMYIHVPMQTGQPRKKILLIGAGDGGGIKRILEYACVEKLVAIDIDEDFVELSKKVSPELASVFDDERVESLSVDGAEYLKNTKEKFDLILVTVGDPFTLSQTMFNQEFVKNCNNALTDDGILTMDGYMPYYTHEDSLNYWDIFAMISQEFPITRICHSTSPLMPGGLITLIFASRKDDPMNCVPRNDVPVKTFWYTPNIHKASFVLPQFMINRLTSIDGFQQS